MKTKETFVSTIILAIALVAMLCVTAQAEILMDYDDGVVNGMHDAAIRDGDFTNITGSDPLNKDVSLFNQMPNWTQVELLNTWLPGQTNQASKPDNASGVGSDRNAIISAPVTNTHAQPLDYIVAGGETYNISFMWKDAWGWVDADWTVKVILYTTGTDEIHTWATNVVVCESGVSQANDSYQTETFTGTITAPPASVGKNLFVAFESSNQTAGYARLDNLYIEIIPDTPAKIVSPAHRATAIPYSGTQLEWTVDEDWACDMYFGTDPCALDLELIDYAGVEGAYSYDTGALDPSTMYYWQVDAIDPNGDVRVPGSAWIFTTADPLPVIDADPNGQVVYAGEDAVYGVDAHNPGTGDTTGLTYQWYKYVDGVSDTELSDGADYTGTATVEMTVIAADVADQGDYYCIVTLAAETAQSLNAVLGIKALEAHWTMDQTDYVGGLYLDISGNGHDADPNGEWVPTFTLGADGTTATGAVTIDPGTGWAQAGTWNPSENTDSLTLSTWVNWDGTGDGGGIVAKRDDWGTDNGMWQLSLNSTGGLWLASGGDFSHTVDAAIPANEWHHVCATIDLDGVAAVYVDGVLLETFAFLMGNKVDSPVIIGVQDADPLTKPFNGSLDDIRIYNYARTLEEVIADYYATSGIGMCLNPPALDISGPEGEPDCVVDVYDFALMANDWLGCGLEPQTDCP